MDRGARTGLAGQTLGCWVQSRWWGRTSGWGIQDSEDTRVQCQGLDRHQTQCNCDGTGQVLGGSQCSSEVV